MQSAIFFSLLMVTLSGHATEVPETEESRTIAAPDAVPDIRPEESDLKKRKRNWVIVPIPMSNPTLDTGLVLGGAYFYPQTKEQKAKQPASVTGAVAMYTSNKSSAFAVGHQSYLAENKWRIAGLLGHADLKLKLPGPQNGDERVSFNWLIDGNFASARVSRKIYGKWYAGILGRYIAFNQSFEIETSPPGFDVGGKTTSVGLGIIATYDNRDRPINSHSGNILEFKTLFNDDRLGSDTSYQHFDFNYRSYHSLSSSLVLAWQVQGCKQSDGAPLWDSCKVNLRGFSVTDYLGKSSASAQVETRWRFKGKWGAVAFLGGGYYQDSFSENREQDLIQSYGIGLRFMVLESQGINMRLDYARSNGSDAIYLSATEAF